MFEIPTITGWGDTIALILLSTFAYVGLIEGLIDITKDLELIFFGSRIGTFILTVLTGVSIFYMFKMILT